MLLTCYLYGTSGINGTGINGTNMVLMAYNIL